MKTFDPNLSTLGENIKNSLQSERIFEKIQWSFSIVMVIILPFWICIEGMQLLFLISIDNNIIVLMLFIIFCMSLILLGIFRTYVIHGITKILQLNEKIALIDTNAITIHDTLCGFTAICDNIHTLLLWKKVVGFALFYRENGGKSIQENIVQFLQGEVVYILQLSLHIKSDLIAHIKNEQTLLRETKKEVEKYIQGTAELDQISEIQKSRLDQQIEQFEELQRVLVKV